MTEKWLSYQGVCFIEAPPCSLPTKNIILFQKNICEQSVGSEIECGKDKIIILSYF